MAGFADKDAIVNAISVSGYGQLKPFLKISSFTTAAGGIYTFWPGSGIPAAGGYSGSADDDVQVTDATAGALGFTNAGGSREMFAVSAAAVSPTLTGTLLVWDRLLYYPGIDHNTTGAQALTTDNNLPRSTTGANVYAFLEVTSVLGATAQTCTLIYTDQGGNTGATTGAQTIVASSVAGRICHAFPFFPLASGDTGIRAVESYEFSAANTGTSALVLAKLIAVIPLPVAAEAQVLDLADGPHLTLPQFEDDAAIFFTVIAANAVANPSISGFAQFVES